MTKLAGVVHHSCRHLPRKRCQTLTVVAAQVKKVPLNDIRNMTKMYCISSKLSTLLSKSMPIRHND